MLGPGARVFLLLDPVFTGRQLALHGKESGGYNGFGREHSPQEDPEISEDFANTTEDAAKVRLEILNGIHRSSIAALGVCGKFS